MPSFISSWIPPSGSSRRSSRLSQADGWLSTSGPKVWPEAFSGSSVPRWEPPSVNSVTRAPSAKRAFQ